MLVLLQQWNRAASAVPRTLIGLCQCYDVGQFVNDCEWKDERRGGYINQAKTESAPATEHFQI